MNSKIAPRRLCSVGAFVLSLLASQAANAGDITFWAKVVGISDGDTFTALVDERTFKVRLAQIDAPESKQPFGNRAKQALSGLIHGKSVQLSVSGSDRNGRRIAWVEIDGIHVNRELVRQGLAWVYPQYATKDSPLYDIEREARTAKRGLWADSAPVPPWQWRARARGSGTQRSK